MEKVWQTCTFKWFMAWGMLQLWLCRAAWHSSSVTPWTAPWTCQSYHELTMNGGWKWKVTWLDLWIVCIFNNGESVVKVEMFHDQYSQAGMTTEDDIKCKIISLYRLFKRQTDACWCVVICFWSFAHQYSSDNRRQADRYAKVTTY